MRGCDSLVNSHYTLSSFLWRISVCSLKQVNWRHCSKKRRGFLFNSEVCLLENVACVPEDVFLGSFFFWWKRAAWEDIIRGRLFLVLSKFLVLCLPGVTSEHSYLPQFKTSSCLPEATSPVISIFFPLKQINKEPTPTPPHPKKKHQCYSQGWGNYF